MYMVFGKIAAFVLALALLASVFAAPALAEDAAEADVQIPSSSYHVMQDGQDIAALKDSNRASSLQLAAGTELTISADRPFSRLYLIWDTPHTGWEISYGGKTLTGGENGFIHEYIELEGETSEAVFRLLEGEHTLCDVYLFGQGTLPDFVQIWEPVLEKADLLVLPTHNDDEHLFFGGTLPYYAGELGLDVQVVYMTNHWAEPYRPHESLDGLWEVGVTTYPVMGPFEDLYASLESLEAAEQCYDREEVRKFQVETLRRFQPSVVVGHDINGEYGHGAHILNAQTLLEALPLTGDASQYPESAEKYGTYDVPKVYLHLWAENQITMDWNVTLEHFGGASALDKAKDGFAQHVSQLTYFEVEDYGEYDCRLFGLAHTTVGPDVEGNDFFENINLNPEPEPQSSSAPSSEPQVEEPQPASSAPILMTGVKKQDNTKTILIIAVLIVVVGFIIIAAALVVSNKKRRRKNKRRRKRPSPTKQAPRKNVYRKR